MSFTKHIHKCKQCFYNPEKFIAFNSPETHPIHIACFSGHVDCVKYILEKFGEEKEVFINKRLQKHFGYTPLHVVCEYGRSSGDCEIVELLLKNGAGVNSLDDDGYSPLHYASILDKVKVVEILVKYGTEVEFSD